MPRTTESVQTATMRKTFKVILGLLLLIALISLYANLLHHRFFFTKVALKRMDTAFLKKGSDIAFKSGEATLRGKLITHAPTGAKVPLLVFCVGSAQSSYASNYSTFLDTFFIQNLPLDNLAILYFDKRGVGTSEGVWYDADFEQRAADAKAAADYAKTLPFIDTTKILIAGHSQGGWIAQVCLAKYPETFSAGISMAGPTFSVRKQLENDYTSVFICSEGLDKETAEKEARNKVTRDIMLASFFPFQQNWRQLKVIKDFEPSAYLQRIKAPLLLLFGENDALVYPTSSKEALAKTFPKQLPSNFDTLTIKGATHSFTDAGLCDRGSSTRAKYSAQCKSVVRTWIQQHL